MASVSAPALRCRTPDATASSSNTPLADLEGIVTPSGLHFERHHTGVPGIDPDAHRLTIHGLVDRPLVFSMDDLVRLPSVSRFHFVECSGNSGREWSPAGASNVQLSHGLVSCSEWTGVSARGSVGRSRGQARGELGRRRRRRRGSDEP